MPNIGNRKQSNDSPFGKGVYTRGVQVPLRVGGGGILRKQKTLLFAFALLTAALPVWAATPMAMAGGGHTVALKSNADIVRTLNLLKKEAEENGTTRIIVGLRIAFAPEGGLTATAVAEQRSEIARMQSVVLEKVPSLKQRPEKIKRFDNSPFMALEVNAAELDALASLTEIASIEEDRLVVPAFGIGVVTPESK